MSAPSEKGPTGLVDYDLNNAFSPCLLCLCVLLSKKGCRDDTPTLSDKEIEAAMAGPKGLTSRGWSLEICDDTKVPILRKTWVTKDFEEGKYVTTKCAKTPCCSRHLIHTYH